MQVETSRLGVTVDRRNPATVEISQTLITIGDLVMGDYPYQLLSPTSLGDIYEGFIPWKDSWKIPT